MNKLQETTALTAGRFAGALCLLGFAAGTPLLGAEGSAPETGAAVQESDISKVPATYAYETELQALEAEGGAYDPQLGEQLLSLGLVYQAQGEHFDAVKALKRAMYIKRVNEGLYGMEQVPILNEIIESNIASENWEELDQAFEQLLFIHRRNFGPGDPRFLPILDQVGAWKVKAYTQGLLKEPPLTTIKAAERLYKDNTRVLEGQYGDSDPRLIDPLYGRAVVSYELLREAAAKPLSEFERGSAVLPSVTYQRVCTVVNGRAVCTVIPVASTGAGLTRYAMQQRDKEMEMYRYFDIVGDSLRQIVEIHDAHPELSVESRARALTHYGDWNMLKGRRGTAMEHYKRAYEMLAADSDGEELVEQYFGTPKSIPTLRLPVPQVDQKLAEVAPQSYVTIAIDVTSTGKARNFHVIEQSDPASTMSVRDARERIREGNFRPRFEDGEPVDTVGFQVKVSGIE